MRSRHPANSPDVEKWNTLHEFEPVGGITLMVCEPASQPDTVNLVMLDTIEGVSVLAEIDRTDPGARARTISLGESVHDALEMAALTWDIDGSGNQKRATRGRGAG